MTYGPASEPDGRRARRARSGAPSGARPGVPDGRRAASGRTTAPAATTRGGRAHLVAATMLVGVTAGLAATACGSGWQLQVPGRPSPSSRAVAGPGPGPSRPAGQRAAPAAPVTVVDKGVGTFTDVQSAGRILGTAGRLRRFRVSVEDGINEDPAAFTVIVDEVLDDQRGWTGSGQLRLQRVPGSAPAEFTIFLASPTTSEAMCAAGGLSTEKFTSCRLQGRVIINDARWRTAVTDYGAPLEVYRAYAINHEVGHQLGHGHEACVGSGRLAPVMQQQTYGLKGCVANAWPYVNGKRYIGPAIP